MLKVSKAYLLIILSLFFSGCATVAYRPPAAGIYHIVGSGQTLYSIARAYGADMNEIIRLNKIHHPDRIGVGERLFIPHRSTALKIEPHRPEKVESAENIVGPKQYRIKWKSITLHHSATREGNAEAFDRNHRKRGMGGLAYHFVIGNGTGSGDGQIEVGWRWRRQVETNRRADIQICLVGDFNKQEPSAEESAVLVQLLKVLTEQYSIPLYNIRRHKDIKGRITECPGGKFPFYRILSAVRRN